MRLRALSDKSAATEPPEIGPFASNSAIGAARLTSMNPIQARAIRVLTCHTRRLRAQGVSVVDYMVELRARTWADGIKDDDFWRNIIAAVPPQ